MKQFWKNNWLSVLLVLQPCLDALAYFTRNDVATAAGYIRLAIMIALPVYLLFRLKEKKGFLLAMAVMGLYSLLHVANGFRVGYISLYFDVAYLLRVLQMPVLAVCFVCLMRDEQTKRQAYRGLALAAVLTGAFLVIAYVTHTGRYTYPGNLGYSGWVIEDNRCAHSIILVSLCCFGCFFALRSGKKWLEVLLPLLVTLAFLTNGTKGCYLSLFGIFGGYTVFLLLEKPVLGKKIRGFNVILFVLLMAFAVVIYPYTPRCRVSENESRAAVQGEIEATLLAKGIDISGMSAEERFADPEIRAVFEHYYVKYIGVLPDLYDRFGMDRVMLHYGMTTDAARLIDVRVMKLTYADMIWEDSDALTKLVGFEVSQVGFDGRYDMENDWPAIYYYYGYLGFALYVGFVLYFIWRVLRKLREDFKGSFTAENICLVLCLGLQLGLAQFSGAILRRPNVSIYLSLVLALIWYQTRRKGTAA